MAKKEFEQYIFPFNGQYEDFDRFVGHVDMMLSNAKECSTGIARKVSPKEKREILKAIAKRLDDKGK